MLQRLSIGELRLNPSLRKSSKGFLDQHATSSSRSKNPTQYHPGTAEGGGRGFGKKGSIENIGHQPQEQHMFHAPETLQPVRRYAKSRNESRLDDNGLLEMKLNALSPEPLRPIPSFKSKTEVEHNNDYRYKSSFKDGFL